MEKIELVTEFGELVTYGEIPCFKTQPVWVMWGSRLFFLEKKTDGEELPVYRERFGVALVKPILEEEPKGS